MKNLSILFLALTLCACDFERFTPWHSHRDGKILVEVREILGPGKRSLELFCETEKIFPCSNYQIKTRQKGLDITFKGVEESDVCLTALGPATTTLSLPELSKGGYSIQLNRDKWVNLGSLVLTEDQIHLDMNYPKGGIKVVRKTTNRVPDRTYWGTVSYNLPEYEAKMQEYLYKVSQLGAKYNKHLPGDYYYFQIDRDGKIVQPGENAGFKYGQNFIFQFPGDDTQFREDLKALAKSYSPYLLVRIYDYQGGIFDNWS